MALYGSVSVDATPNGRDKLVFSWDAVQDAEAKTSTVSWVMQLVADAYGRLDVTDAAVYPWAVTVDGQAFSGNSNIFIGANETITLASGTAVLAHGADGTKTFVFTFMQDFCGLVWSGETVINEVSGIGTVELDAFMAEEEPEEPEEEPEEFDMQSFLIGLALGMCGKGFVKYPIQSGPQQYLYGDVKGIALPAYDTKEYPYVTIETFVGAMYMLRLRRVPAVYEQVFETPYMLAIQKDHSFENEIIGWDPVDYSKTTIANCKTVVWANHDVLKEDGTLYLAGSEPVPI